eukprot:gnl/Trimastix_PCT/611.p1 GENE.gnl/Trimastix_PCT/611~~gnl/Trimastix_PCT/611.p1  ORF type:complete len:609 (+),score=220.28 gnl/Trimastix_PCT/611:24-1829(+)
MEDQASSAAAPAAPAAPVEAPAAENPAPAQQQGARQPRKPKQPKQPKQKKPQQPKGGNKKGGKAAASQRADLTFSVPKNTDFPSWFDQIIDFAGILERRYPCKGAPVFMPYGFALHHRIMSFFEERFEIQGIDRAQFPTLIPESMLNQEGNFIAGFSPEVFWVTHGGKNALPERLALRPTSETAMYSTFAMWVRSYQALPIKVFQTCQVFRCEGKETRPLIRAREIYWNEAHMCHATPEANIEGIRQYWETYDHVFNQRLCIHGQKLRRPVWDRFPGAEYTDVLDTIMPCGRVLQIASSHNFGTGFSTAFDIKFLDNQQQMARPYLNCAGVSSRVLAGVLAVHGDDKGLVLPPELARYQVVIVPIPVNKKQEKELQQAGELESFKERFTAYYRDVQRQLMEAGIRVHLDDRAGTPGPKYYHWEMKGVPVRLEIGKRDFDEQKVVLARRDTGEKMFGVEAATLLDSLRALFVAIADNLRARSLEGHNARIATCYSVEEVRAAMAVGGFARVPFCTLDRDGAACDEALRTETKIQTVGETDRSGAEVRGFPVVEEAAPEGRMCVGCMARLAMYERLRTEGKADLGEAPVLKPAVCWAYLARAY